MTDTETKQALSHLRVLDLSRVLAGPWSSQILADLGADVLKIESPDGGDDTRKWGPPFLPENADGTADAAYFAAANRNKRSLAIDFSKPEGAQAIRDLAASCDIVIENFKLGGLKKYGLDYASISAIKPDVIYCSITGFGQTGPYAPRAGYDFLIQGMTGLMSITGVPDGKPGAGPMKVGIAVADLFTGMYATVSILAAVTHRTLTGEGQYIDCALLDTQLATLSNQASNFLVGGSAPTRMGNSHPNVVPYHVYEVADGHLIIAVGNDRQFRHLCEALKAPLLADDPRFVIGKARVANRDVLDQTLTGLMKDMTREAVINLLEKAQVPCGPINDVAEAFADPQVVSRQMVVPMARDGYEVPTVAFPAKLSRTPAQYRTAPPTLGADTDDTLARVAGYDTETIRKLRESGVIG